jgi:hypothetical protein
MKLFRLSESYSSQESFQVHAVDIRADSIVLFGATITEALEKEWSF